MDLLDDVSVERSCYVTATILTFLKISTQCSLSVGQRPFHLNMFHNNVKNFPNFSPEDLVFYNETATLRPAFHNDLRSYLINLPRIF